MKYYEVLKRLLVVFFCLIPCSYLFSQQGWHQVQSGTTSKLYGMLNSVDFLGKIWIVGENGLMLLSTNFGSSFVPQTIPTTNDLYDMEFLEMANGGICAVGKNGTIIRTTDEGATWHLVNSGVTASLRGIMDGYIVGDSGTFLRTTSGGVNWIRMNPGIRTKLNDVYDQFGAFVIAVGDSGRVIRYNVSLNSFNILQSGVNSNLRSIHRCTKLSFFGNIACGDNGVILTTTDLGNNWTLENAGINTRLNGIFETKEALSFEIIWTCGAQGKIFSSIDDGVTWNPAISPVSSNLNTVSFGMPHHGVPSITGFIVGDGGVILRAFNQGITSTYIHSEILPLEFELYQNYPNPFNPVTNIEFGIPKRSDLTLKINDITGREVTTLVDQILDAGNYRISFDAGNLTSGTYFYRIQTEGFTETKKMILIK